MGYFHFGLVYLELDIKQAVRATQATEDTLAECSQCRYRAIATKTINPKF